MTTNRPKRRKPTASWQIGVDMATAAVPRKLHNTDVDMGDGMVYERRVDRLRIETGPGTVLTITPGSRFAEALAKGFATMPDLPTTHANRETNCDRCGATVLQVSTEHQVLLLNPKPDPNGVWLLVADDRARLLQPMEEPTGPTYEEHMCHGSTT